MRLPENLAPGLGWPIDIHTLPSDAFLQLPPNIPPFWVPNRANWCDIYLAGHRNGLLDAGPYIEQGGTYDFQPGDETFYTKYTNASNFAVGVYMNDAGYSLLDTEMAGDLYTLAHSSSGSKNTAKKWW